MRSSLRPLFILTAISCGDEPKHESGTPSGDDSDQPVDTTPDPDTERETGLETGVDSGRDTAASCPEPDLSTGAVTVDATCAIRPVGTFDPVVEWTFTVGEVYSRVPTVASLTDDDGDGDVDNDDVPDVVVLADDAVRCLTGDGSGLAWEHDLLGEVWFLHRQTLPIADFDGDGVPEVALAATPDGTDENRLWMLDGLDGSTDWIGAPVEFSWSSFFGSAVADLEGDGNPEYVHGRNIVDALTGVGLGNGEYGTALYHSAVADLDLDGVQEVVTGNAAYGPTGASLWANGEDDGYVAVADFDADGLGEVVVTDYSSYEVRLQDDDGSVLWRTPLDGSHGAGPPLVADLDGDDEPEIGVWGGMWYHVLDGDGTVLWQSPIHKADNTFAGAAAFDFEGDGVMEVVYSDDEDLLVLDGPSGAVLMETASSLPPMSFGYPVIADVDGDDSAEILLLSDQEGLGEDTLTVIGSATDSWMPGRRIWNQYAYAVTNVEDDAAISTSPTPSWEHQNTFRVQELTEAPYGIGVDAVPALVETCTLECDRGRLRVVVRIGNVGTADLPPGVGWTLEAASGGVWTQLASGATSDVVPSGGTTEGIQFDLAASDVPEGALRFTVDPEGTFEECDEGGNVLVITKGLCP